MHAWVEDLLESLHHSGVAGLEIHAYVATCRDKDPKRILQWTSDQLNTISAIKGLTVIRSAILFSHWGRREPPTHLAQFETMLAYEGWKTHKWRLRNVKLGGAMVNTYWALVIVDRDLHKHLTPPPEEVLETDISFGSRLDKDPQEAEIHMDTINARPSKETKPPTRFRPKGWGDIRERNASVDQPWVTIFDPRHPAPSWEQLELSDTTFFGKNTFERSDHSETFGEGVKKVTLKQTLAIMGLPVKEGFPLLYDEETLRNHLHTFVAT